MSLGENDDADSETSPEMPHAIKLFQRQVAEEMRRETAERHATELRNARELGRTEGRLDALTVDVRDAFLANAASVVGFKEAMLKANKQRMDQDDADAKIKTWIGALLCFAVWLVLFTLWYRMLNLPLPRLT